MKKTLLVLMSMIAINTSLATTTYDNHDGSYTTYNSDNTTSTTYDNNDGSYTTYNSDNTITTVYDNHDGSFSTYD